MARVRRNVNMKDSQFSLVKLILVMNKQSSESVSNIVSDFWRAPVTIAPNNFKHKSLSNWACNFTVGCGHGCRFCYVPEVSTIKLSSQLAEFGVADPDSQWGDYVLVRPFDEKAFLASLRAAERTHDS